MLAHLAGDVGQDLVLVLELDPEHRVRQRSRSPSPRPRSLLPSSTSSRSRRRRRSAATPSTRAPVSVTATEYSKCADSEPSAVRAVQPSASTRHAGAADVDHRLDRQHHARAQLRSPARLAVVRHLRLLVQRRADAVADELADHREAVRLHVPLHRVRRCRDSAVPGLHLLRPPARAPRGSRPAAGRASLADLADRRRCGRRRRSSPCTARRSRCPTMSPSASARLAGDAVHDHVVDRRAEGRRIPLVVQEGRHARPPRGSRSRR